MCSGGLYEHKATRTYFVAFCSQGRFTSSILPRGKHKIVKCSRLRFVWETSRLFQSLRLIEDTMRTSVNPVMTFTVQVLLPARMSPLVIAYLTWLC